MSIFKPKNTVNYHYRFMADAKICTGSCHTANKANAVKYEAMKREEAYKKQFLTSPDDPDHITVIEAIARYFKDNAHRKIPKTYHVCATKLVGEKTDITTGKLQKVAGLFPNGLLHEVRERDVQALITGRFKEGNTPATIIYELVFFSQVIKHAKRLGFKIPLIDFAELKKANKLRQSKGRLRYLTILEERAILHQLSIDLPNDTPTTKLQRQDCLHFTACLLDLGCRYSELAEMQWKDINLEEKIVALYRPKVRNESMLMMSNRVFEILEARHSIKAPEQIYIFESKLGSHKGPSSRAFKNACARAGVKGVSFHTLRHTYASKLVQAEVPLYDVQQLLGHSNSATTQRYAHLAPNKSAMRAQNVLNAINAE